MRTSSAFPAPSSRGALLLAPLLLLAACEAPETDAPPADPEPAAEPEGEPADPSVEEVPTATVDLEEVEESGVTGEAAVMDADDTEVYVVDVEGLPAEAEYEAHIHTGNCAEGGGVAEPLNPIMGGEDGTGSSTTMFDTGTVPTDEDHFVQVHGEDGDPIACGDLDGSDDSEMEM